VRIAASPPLIPRLPIERNPGLPLHRQVYEALRQAILGGTLRPGQRVPSTRALATELEISRFPVLAAYEQLLHEGYLEGRVGSGTYVCAAPPERSLQAVRNGPRDKRASSARRSALSDARRARRNEIPRARDEGGLRPFRASLPALDQFPHVLWSRIVARHAHRLSPSQMVYGDPAGLGELRAAIAEHLRTARAVRCEAEHVLIVSGSQAALRLCATVLLGRGEPVAIEEPSYSGARAALLATGAELVPVPVDDEGIDVRALGALGSRVRAVYVTPSHQHPLGMCMSATRRLALLDWAVRNDAWIFEDDYDSEYRYVSRPLGALQGMDTADRVVYVGTFSKVLFPALRIGYLVVPPQLWNAFVEAREALDVFSPTLYQLALTDFLREGHFVRHLRRMRGVYMKRRQALLDAIDMHCRGVLTVYNADAGLHLATLLPNDVNDVDVVKRMADRRLIATALSTCYIGRARRNGLLLGFGGTDEATLTAATRTLGEVLRERA